MIIKPNIKNMFPNNWAIVRKVKYKFIDVIWIKSTVKPLYLEHVDNWFLKLVLYYFNKYIFKNHLSTCSR
jgi:hypothetical protein